MASREQNIPRKGISEPSHGVHRPSSTEVGSSSAAINNPQPDHTERSHTPPPYSGPASPTPTPRTQQAQMNYPGLPNLDYRLYSPPSFTLSQDQKSITSYDPQLSTQRTALLTLIQQLAYMPPKPQIWITGKNASTGSVDFEIKLNAMNLIIPVGEKNRMNYIKTIPPGEIGYRGKTKRTAGPELEALEDWVRNYCEDDASIKHFALERVVTNWDTSYLEGRLLTLFKSLNYQGSVNITFPVTHSRVVVHSPDKMNRFISTVTKVFTGSHKYEPVKSVWPYANVPRGESGRVCAVQDEETWFNDWKDAIAHAALSHRMSWVTSEDLLEFLMQPKPMVQGKPSAW